MDDLNIIILQISIPNDKPIPSIITTFTPEENYAMIQIGSNAITEARKSVISFTNKKISEEYKFKINELEKNLIKLQQDKIEISNDLKMTTECLLFNIKL